jgi:glucosamine kinase
MILIADGGSTKSSWSQLDEAGNRINFSTEGYNPDFVDTAFVVDSLQRNLPDTLPREQVREVHYYGAGVSSAAKAEVLAAAMRQVFPRATVSIEHDLLAAARALLGHQSGFAAILGTGTNSCLYDGERVTMSVDSLGYFLGDEGSGSYIGKRLLRDFLRGQLPKGLEEAFRTEFPELDRNGILDRLYNQPLPNRFLASFAKFCYDHNNFSYCREIVLAGFEAFFEQLVTKYPRYQEHSFNCVGSVAYNFRDALEEVCRHHQMPMGRIVRAPIDNLVRFHLGQPLQ